MGSDFKCFINFEDNIYDIVINDDISSVCFTNIYEKIQQIFKIVLNQNISFETHLFEIIDNNNNPNKSKFIDSFECFIKHETVIRVILKYQNTYENFNHNYSELQPIYSQNEDIIQKNNTRSFIPHEYYCDICPESVDRVSDPRLSKRLKLELNFDSYKRYTDMLEVIKSYSNNRCDSLSDYEWLNIIPFKMRAFGYRNFGVKNWKNCFDYFMEHYIKILEMSPNFWTACSLFPFFHEFNEMALNPNKSYYHKIIQLRESFKINSIQSSINAGNQKLSSVQKICDNNVKSELEKTLESNESDIRAFHLMIQTILMHGIESNKKVKHKPKQWDGISKKMKGYGINWSSGQCSDRFLKWVKFYAQNFDDFENSKNSKNAIEIFNLFKIIHTINLKLIYKDSNPTFRQIMKIGESDQIRDYLLNVYMNSQIIQSELDKSQTIVTSEPMVNNNTKIMNETLPSNETEDLVPQPMDLVTEEPDINRSNEVVLNPRDPRRRSISGEDKTPSRDPRKRPINEEVIDNPRDPRKRPKIKTEPIE